MMRQRIHDIVELKEVNSLASRLYNQLMLILVVISMLPLAFKEDYEIFAITDVVIAVVFIVDYLLNRMTADIRFGQRGIMPFRPPIPPKPKQGEVTSSVTAAAILSVYG